MPDRPPVFVHSLPALIGAGTLRGASAVVVDVLRATTVMIHALAAGCEAVVPCGEVEEAKARAAALPTGSALLGGERGGLPIAGFDLGNSPASFTPEVCRGKTLVITTTNGTRAILASLDAETVRIAALVNLHATARVLLNDEPPGPVHVVCSGTEGFVSLEDTLAAGGLVTSLAEAGCALANDEALIASALWRQTVAGSNDAEALQAAIRTVLMQGRGGHNVRRIGLEPDLADAARLDRFSLTAELVRDPLRIVVSRPIRE